jgi:meso-butanediol dehydrogenase / (S,S)-butanediol dehydrogenase / diacetyl reductase
VTSLDGKVAIVTGGASGMGAATVRRLAAGGASVVAVDRNAAGLLGVASGVAAVATVAGDVSSSSFCDQLVESVSSEHGKLDVLVNAAGIIVRSPAHDTTDEDWRRIFSVNVDGVFYMSRAAVRVMLAQGSGAIVNFGSVWGDVGNAGHCAYAATKGAVHQLTRSMALEHARDGIRVNAVCPGEIRTPMLASERSSPMSEDDLQRLADETVPMGRLGEPEEVAEVVAFLASDAASYMTGSLVAVDAGYSAR